MENRMEYNGNPMKNKLKEETERIINDVMEDGINTNNIDFLGKVVDIHKDISNEEYWEEKEENYMRYRTNDEYDRRRYRGDNREEYGRGRRRDSRGRYMESGHDSRYRGHDYIDRMYDNYGDYVEADEDHKHGNYGAKSDMLQSIDETMDAVYNLVCVISEDATPEVMNIIRKHIKKMNEL